MKPRVGGVAPGESKKSETGTGEKEKVIRTKERTVREIIEKVSVWRKLYNGITMPHPD